LLAGAKLRMKLTELILIDKTREKGKKAAQRKSREKSCGSELQEDRLRRDCGQAALRDLSLGQSEE
jgi:hypothetical protein